MIRSKRSPSGICEETRDKTATNGRPARHPERHATRRGPQGARVPTAQITTQRVQVSRAPVHVQHGGTQSITQTLQDMSNVSISQQGAVRGALVAIKNRPAQVRCGSSGARSRCAVARPRVCAHSTSMPTMPTVLAAHSAVPPPEPLQDCQPPPRKTTSAGSAGSPLRSRSLWLNSPTPRGRCTFMHGCAFPGPVHPKRHAERAASRSKSK